MIVVGVGVLKEPPANTPRVVEEHDDNPYLPVNKSPKSKELPVEEIVTYSIEFNWVV